MKEKQKIPEKWLVIVNPVSANGRTGSRWGRTEKILRRRLPPFDVRFTEAPHQANRMAAQAVDQGYTCIAVHGGDGTVNEVINGLMADSVSPEAVIALLPSGTGADLVRTVGVSHSLSQAADQAARGQPRPMDVCLAEFMDLNGMQRKRYFINVTDIGFGGDLVRYVNSRSKRLGGRISFLKGLLVTLFRYTNKRIRLTLDDRPAFEGKASSIVVANGQYFGGGMWVAPEARPNDERLEVVLIGDVTRSEVLTNIPRLYRGTLATHPKVRTFPARKVMLESEEEVFIDMDGELVGRLPVRLEVSPRKIRVLV